MRRTQGFTLVELMVVIGIIVLISGMSVPLMTSFFDNQKLPRAAKLVGAYIRNAQVSAVNYMMMTQIEVVPGTTNALRLWGLTGISKRPTAPSLDQSWDRVDAGYVLVAEAKRLPKEGGRIRFLPMNRYSYKPQNAESFGELSINAWEFAEYQYTHYELKEFERGVGSKEITPGIMNLSFEGAPRALSDCVTIDTPMGIQIALGTQRDMPQGVAFDTVNYVSYMDGNGDGMPDGNPLGTYYYPAAATNNKVIPLVLAAKGLSIPNTRLYKDAATRRPNPISASLCFGKEGTLMDNFSLKYYAQNPVGLGGSYFSATAGVMLEPVIAGFVIFDVADASRHMVIEVTGVGAVRQAYGAFAPVGTIWGGNFNNQSLTGI
ncbi:MAG: type II secretion system protein [Planctomycetota bacterium]